MTLDISHLLDETDDSLIQQATMPIRDGRQKLLPGQNLSVTQAKKLRSATFTSFVSCYSTLIHHVNMPLHFAVCSAYTGN